MCLMPANPDISGIGVRIAIYLQNLLCFFPAFWALWDGHVSIHELQSAETQSTTNLVLAFAILISCIVQAFTLGLTSYHATIILSLSWMNNTNAFIYFLLYVRYKCQGNKPQVQPNWASWIDHVKDHIRAIVGLPPASRVGAVGAQEATDDPPPAADDTGLPAGDRETGNKADPRETKGAKRGLKGLFKRIALLLGSLHLTLMAALGTWLWSDPRSFGAPDARCAVDAAHLAVVGVRVPFGSEPLRIASLVLYSLFLIPGLNLLLPIFVFLGLYIWHSSRMLKKASVARGSASETTGSGTAQLVHTRIATAYHRAVDSPVFPISVGLALLLVINIIFIADIELALRRNIGLQSQILAVLLVLLPLRDVLEMALARRLNQQWSRALRDKNIGMIRALVHEDFDPTVLGEGSISALQISASERDWDTFHLIATAIIRRGEPPAKFYDEHATFQIVIADNSLDGLNALIRANVDPNSTLLDGKIPLEFAMSSSKWEIAHALVNSKVANTVFQDDQNALEHASRAGQWTLVRALIEANARFKNLHLGDQTLLRVAADAAAWEVVAALLDKGASKDDGFIDGQALLKSAIRANAWGVVYRLAGWATHEGCSWATLAIALQTAFDRRQWQMIELLLEGGADPTAISDNGRTLLEVASHAKAWGVVRILVDGNHEINVNIVFQDDPNDSIKTALEAACHDQEWEVAELLLKKGADPNLRGGDYAPTVLETLCAAGRFEVAERLFPWNARTSSQSSGERSAPTQSAGTQNYLDITKALLDRGAVLDSSQLAPALRMACAGGRPDIVELLLDRDANPNLQASSLGCALHLACSGGNLEIITLLLDRNANPNIRSDKQGCPLHTACYKGNIDVVRLLLDRKADPNFQANKLGRPLDMGCLGGHSDIVKLLLDRGADPKLKSDHPSGGGLHLACSTGNLDIVRLLLDAGAKLTARLHVEGLGRVLDVACLGGHSDIVKLLLDRGADPNLTSDHPSGGGLRLACSLGNLDFVRLLLDAGADPNTKSSVEGVGNVLDVACLGGHFDIVKLLLDRGARPNLKSDHPLGGVLHLACSIGNLEMVRLLLDGDASPTSWVDGIGIPLHVASSKGHPDIVGLLLNRGALLNYQSGPFDTALQAASAGGHLGIVELLLKKGADANLQGGKYGSALAAARAEGHGEIAELLLNSGAVELPAIQYIAVSPRDLYD